MAESYLYRFFKSSWGIWIKITAEALPLTGFGDQAYEIEPGLSLSLEKRSGILPDGIPYLPIGLHLVATEMQSVVAKTGPLVIRVLQIELVITDYQPEGIAYALAGWMIQKFQIPCDLPPVHFEKARNHYVFTLPKPTFRDEEFTRLMQ